MMTQRFQVSPEIRDLIQEERLPEAYLAQLSHFLAPCAYHIALHHSEAKNALIWGVSGSQGSGKSTLVRFLAALLTEQYGLQVASLSLDDFYLDQASRQTLASQQHPLLATRGVPGTHDCSLGINTLEALKAGERPLLPSFDKGTDNPLAKSEWQAPQQAADIILFEGWCVGSVPESDDTLELALNDLERQEDSEGVWRTIVNNALREDYARWWSLLDGLLFLQAPSFEQVYSWRSLQEKKLRERYERAGQAVPAGVMNEAQISRFIAHYERLTRGNLRELPKRADLVLELAADHRFQRLIVQPGKGAEA